MNDNQKVLKARLKVAVDTLEKIAALPRGGLAKRLAVATLHFITPPPPKLYPRLICPHCQKPRSVSKNGFRPHHHHGKWCKGTYQWPAEHQTSNIKHPTSNSATLTPALSPSDGARELMQNNGH